MTCKDGRFNTGNPICSNKPQDLHDNAMIIDAFTNSDADFVEDRFGVQRKTIAGIEKEANNTINGFGDLITQRINEKIIAQGGVEIINDWDQASDENVFSAEFVKGRVVNEWGDCPEKVLSQGFLSENVVYKSLESLGISDSGLDQLVALSSILSSNKFVIAPDFEINVDLSQGSLVIGDCTISGNLKINSLVSVDSPRIFISDSTIESITVNYLGESEQDRGVVVQSNSTIGSISVDSKYPNKGSGNIRRRAISIGSESELSSNISIGRLVVTGWCYAVASFNVSNLKINGGDIHGHLQGFWIRNTDRSSFANIETHETSDMIVGRAGENGFIIDSTDHNLTRGIVFNNCVVNESGEHGYRIGGNKVVSHIYFNNCISKSSGKGVGTGIEPNHHGGCGFKVLGSTAPATNVESYESLHTNIHFTNCTVYNINIKDQGNNFDGFHIGRTMIFTLTDCSVRTSSYNYFGDDTPISTHSAVQGIAIVGSSKGLINNLYIEKTLRNAIYLFDVPNTSSAYWGTSSEDITFSNINTYQIGQSVLHFHSNGSTYRRVSLDTINIPNAQKLFDATMSLGRIIGCSFTNFFSVNDGISSGIDDNLLGLYISGRFLKFENIQKCSPGSTINSALGVKTFLNGAWV